MSLLLCRREPVKNPYYIEVLALHIYSSQELCYVIYHHPLLVLDDFVEPGLFAFIRDELGLGFLAGRMEKLIEAGSRPEDALLLFLSECDYYTEKEVQSFKAQAAAYRQMAPEEYELARADYLFGKRQYGRAAARYEKLLESFGRDGRERAFMARLLRNLGAAYAQLFCFGKALEAYERSYEAVERPEVLREIWLLTRFAPNLQVKETLRGRFRQELTKGWEQEAAQAELDAGQAEEVRALRALFKREPASRREGAQRLVARWKQEYRKMV